jgi:membrane-bound metal-dependent hydrolase YbcI (DUF457 family)
MSSPIGHFLGAAIVYNSLSKAVNLPKLSKWHYLGFAVLTSLPDIDLAMFSIMRHRGVTHGILGTLAISFLFYLIIKSADVANVPRSGIVICSILCAVIHPVMDTIGCPLYPIEWFAPIWYLGVSIDPYWTLIPQAYFTIGPGEHFYFPLSTIIANIPQLAFEVLILSGILAYFIVKRRLLKYLSIVVTLSSWIVWRLFFPTVWMR